MKDSMLWNVPDWMRRLWSHRLSVSLNSLHLTPCRLGS